MIHHNTDPTFRGLPLTAEQDAEIRHYLNRKARLGKPWNTPELRGMLEDMLLPPSIEDDSQSDIPPGIVRRRTRNRVRRPDHGANRGVRGIARRYGSREHERECSLR